MTTLISATAGKQDTLARLSEASLIYRSAAGYALLMRALYGRAYSARDRAVAAQVPAGSSVLELCCGPARLYRRELRGRVAGYRALDASEPFVRRLERLGVDARVADVATAVLPEADVVLMQASLYHFLPDARPMVERMRAAARERVVISEPVRNLASSSSGLLARVSAASTATAGEARRDRFDAASLEALMAGFGDAVRSREPIPGGREMVYVLAGAA